MMRDREHRLHLSFHISNGGTLSPEKENQLPKTRTLRRADPAFGFCISQSLKSQLQQSPENAGSKLNS